MAGGQVAFKGDDYLQKNVEYWQQGYPAIWPDHNVFRFFGRVVKKDFPHLIGGKLLDFGCGQGAAVSYFHMNGMDARGVDICEPDIAAAKIRYPHLANRFSVCKPHPNDNPFYGFETKDLSIVTGLQAFYYFTDTDLAILLKKLHAAMKPGGVFYATMMGVESKEFFDNSTEDHDGLRRVNFTNDRLVVKDYCMSFVESEAHMKKKFDMFRPVHCGYYAAKYREDEGDGFHRTFVGVKD